MANILTCYYRPKPGGFCKRLFRAMEALLAAGHTVHYLSVEPFPIEHPRCHHHVFPWPKRHSDTLFFWAFFYSTAPVFLLYLSLRHPISHVFGFSPIYAALLNPIRWLKPIQLTCFLRGDILFAHQMKSRPFWIVHLDKWIEAIAIHRTQVVSLSSSLLQTVLQRHPLAVPKSTKLLPNDMPVPKVFQTPTQPAAPCADDPHGRLRLGFAGVLEPTKNIDYIFDLLKFIPLGRYVFLVFGAGPLEKEMRQRLVHEDFAGCIQWKGWVASHTIWPQIDLLLAPSRCEGMPNAVLEAMAHGVPILASDIPAHREILPKGHCLPLDRPDQWREPLMNILTCPEPELARMRADQQRMAGKLQFDWDARVVEAILG